MSMYGMLFGESESAGVLLAVIGLSKTDFYRYRDCYLDEKGRIAVYTRGGGGNRGCYCDADYVKDEERTVEFAGEKHREGCVVVTHSINREHPCYLSDEDDDFDSTYATFYFRVPETADREALAQIKPEIARDEAWQIALEALRKAAR